MTQLLSPYILTLFELHHCVIIPSLGAFVMSTKPAFWDKEEQVIVPLSKNLVFNKNLTHEDGLLTNHIAHARQISYEAAAEWMRWQIKLLHQQLNQGESCVLEKIGTLFRKENNIVFVKDTQFQVPFESFGLSTVAIVPKLITTNNIVQPSTISYMNTPKTSLQNKKKNKKQKLGPSLLILLILTLLAIGIYYIFFVSKKSVEPLKTQQPIIESNLDLPEEEWDDDEDEELFTNSEEPKSAIDQNKNYYLVAGVYQVKKNALHMVDSLKSSGFVNAGIVDQIEDKYRVAFSNKPYINLEQAQQEKERLDDMGYTSWIFIKEEK